MKVPLSATSLSTCPLLQSEESCPAALQSILETWVFTPELWMSTHARLDMLETKTQSKCLSRNSTQSSHHLLGSGGRNLTSSRGCCVCVCRSGKTSRQWRHWAEPWSLVSIWKWKRMDTALSFIRTQHTGETQAMLNNNCWVPARAVSSTASLRPPYSVYTN